MWLFVTALVTQHVSKIHPCLDLISTSFLFKAE